MSGNPSSIRELLARFGHNPNRALGQNFLADGEKALAIAQAATGEGLPVLEIGPGLGALTAPLLSLSPRVVAVEIDAALVEALQALYGQNPRLTLVQGDFCKADLPALYAALGGPFAVAANLPYYATTPICLRLLASGLPIPRLVLMAQREAAARFFAQPSSRQYGPLAILAQYYYQPRLMMELSPADYYPQPQVSSQVVLLERQAGRPFLPGLLPFLEGAFAMRRKTLMNNLKGLPGASAALAALGLPPGCRAEGLPPETLAALFRALAPAKEDAGS